MPKQKYQINDLQFQGGRLFADGEVFTSKEAVRRQLIDFHSIDSTNPKTLEKMTLRQILDYGEWEIIPVKVRR